MVQLDTAKWNKDIARAGFRLYDSRPLDNRIVYGDPFVLHVGFAPADVVNLYSETRELIDGKRFFCAYADGGFVGVLDIGKYTRTYMLEHCDSKGFDIVVKSVGTRYANTFEPDCRVIDIVEAADPFIPSAVSQEDPQAFLHEAMEETIRQSAERAEERKGFFRRLLGR